MTEALDISAHRQPLGSQARPVDSQLAWVIAAQNGDSVAFNRLVLKWQQKIYNLSLRLLQDPEEASEATQEAFLLAYKGIRRFRLESQFSTWLFRIASNQCVTRLRKRPAQPPLSIDEEVGEGTPLSQRLAARDDQEGDLLRQEQQQRVRRAIGALPAEQRLTVELKFFQEMTFEEISSILEAPVSTVKSRFYSGLQGLKSRLGSSGKGRSQESGRRRAEKEDGAPSNRLRTPDSGI